MFRLMTDVGPKNIVQVLEFFGLTKGDVVHFSCHQVNRLTVHIVAMYAGLPKDKYSAETFSLYGNCGSAAVTMDLCRQLSTAPARQVCMATFGVGLSWGFCLVNMEGAFVAPVRTYVTPAGSMTRQEKIDYWISYFKDGNNA